jgi:hypothetical protein
MNQPLRELWDRIVTGPPPLAEVSASGELVMRRRRRWAVAGAAAAVLAIVGGGAAVQFLAFDDWTNGDAAAASIPAPPAGTRWVGAGGAVVAVPDWWTTGETRCFAPVEDTVYFDLSATAECSDAPAPAAVREVSALAVLDAKSGYGEYEVRTMQPVGEVAGREVLEREDCEGWFDGVCRRLFAVPSQGVVFAVTIAEEGDGSYEEIRDSLRILPDTLTTVPLATSGGWTPAWGAEPRVTDSLVDALQNAGLRVEIETAKQRQEDDTALYASLPAGSLLGTSPELGSVIDVGGTVTVTVAGRPAGAER